MSHGRAPLVAFDALWVVTSVFGHSAQSREVLEVVGISWLWSIFWHAGTEKLGAALISLDLRANAAFDRSMKCDIASCDQLDISLLGLPRRIAPRSIWVPVLFTIAGMLAPKNAAADEGDIKHPGQHISYIFELEPEAIFVFNRPIGDGPGLGVRGSINIANNAFIPSINDSVALTFGIDKDRLRNSNTLNFPIALQWNFWLSKHWSVMGEPGVFIQSDDKTRAYFQVWGGARLHFNDYIALTWRVSLPNVPAFSMGVSFFL